MRSWRIGIVCACWTLWGCSGATHGDASHAAGSGGSSSDAVGGGGGATQASEVTLEASAWDARFDLMPVVDSAASASSSCKTFAGTLAFVADPGSGSLLAFWGKDGKLTKTTWVSDGGGKYHATAALDYTPPDCNPTARPLLYQGVTIGDLRLTAVDADGDGDPENLTGQGNGTFTDIDTSIGQVTGGTFDVVATLSAKPDVTAPVLTQVSNTSPFEAIGLTASEPLAQSSLQLDGLPDVMFDAPTTQRPLMELYATGRILPLSGAWPLTGSARDFAGLAAPSMEVHSLGDPGIFAQDGFEAAPLATLSERASIVEGSAGSPLEPGQHALLLDASASALFHLKRTPGQNVISANIALLSTDPSVAQKRGQLLAGVVGGTKPVRLDWSPGLYSMTKTFQNLAATELVRASATLDEEGEDVLVYLQAANPCGADVPGGGGHCISTWLLLVDDLKLESIQ
jgi:hypothetical protein